MGFFRFLQANRLFVHYITLLIVIVGMMSLFKMKREARPNVNFNRVAIAVAYPGASPDDIEELVIDPIEERIAEVDGIEEYRSVSFVGAGSVSIKIDDEYPNPSDVVDEIRRNLSSVNELPIEVDDPVITEVKAVNIPVLRLALYGELSPFEMKMEIEKLKDFLRSFSGVQGVNYTGLEDLQLKIMADPQKLNAQDITLIELMSGLSNWSKQRPGGLLEGEDQTVNLTIGTDYKDIEKINNFVVRSNDAGREVKLKSVADVSYEAEVSQTKSLFADKNATLMTIIKKPSSDIITTVEEVKKGLEKYKKNLPKGLFYKLYTDESVRVRDRLKVVTSNATFGIILVLLLLIVFLDWRSAIVTSIGIPVAILGGIITIYLLGSTMNSLVLVGMIIALGMLVDDAIVVCENIYFKLESGMNPLNSAIYGVKEVMVPVMASVLTTIFAFFPVLFMKGIMGQFLRVIPLTVIAMLIFSLFEALLILPVHAKELMKAKEKKDSFFTKIEKKYGQYLKWSLKSKWLVLIAVIVIFFSSIYQGKLLFERFVLFPAKGLGGMSVRVELDRNTPVKKTTEKVKELTKELKAVAEGTFDSIYATIGSITTGGSSGSRQVASHLGAVSIVFVSGEEFLQKEKSVVAGIRRVAKEFTQRTGVRTSITLSRPGPPIGKPVQLQITSRNTEEGIEVATEIKKELANIKGVHSIETDLDGDSKKYRFLIDNSLAVSEGIEPSAISQTVFSASTGRVTSEILINNEKVELLVGVATTKSFDQNKILDLKIRNKAGYAMPLRSFARFVEERGASSIQRLNGVRTITVFAEVEEKIITGKEANKKIRPFIKQLRKNHPTIHIEMGGGERDRMSALRDTMRLYILALVLIFMVISLSFQSLLYPFLVLLTVPMGLCGVFWALKIHNQPLSLMAIIGIVGLSGVVVNISIIFLKYVQEKIKNGASLNDSLIEAGIRRLRPICITTVTTLFGLFPIIYGIGGTDTFVQPIALALGWGLFVAAFLSIFTLPALVSIVTFLQKK